jgi:hypothetical protein
LDNFVRNFHRKGLGKPFARRAADVIDVSGHCWTRSRAKDQRYHRLRSAPALSQRWVSIVPLLLAVEAGQEEEERATHESRLPFPPCSCPFPGRGDTGENLTTCFLFCFWIAVDAVHALLTYLAGGYIRNHVRLSVGCGRSRGSTKNRRCL